MIVDLFAGPGGWSVGVKMLGLDEIGIEWDDAACRTRAKAGHLTIRADVSQYPTECFQRPWPLTGLIASPPCQDFSVAGKQAGIEGYRGRHVYEVLRWARALSPPWIACEQVPPVLGIWEDFARIMRDEMGYFVWTGVVNAADFGVPQVRKRAILMASRARFRAPQPTHTQRPSDDIFGSDLLPWVTMAEGLGWGFTHRPAGTVASATEKGGPHGLDGGSKARAMYKRAQDDGFWIDTRRGVSSEAFSPDDGPAPTVTSRTGNNWVARTGDKPEEKKYRLKGGMWSNNNRLYDPDEEPAPVVAFGNDSAGWEWTRPSTTVTTRMGTIFAPGWRVDPDKHAQDAEGSIKVTIPEVSLLQSFPEDYPWQGSKTKKFQQVGNACPPLLAYAILKELV